MMRVIKIYEINYIFCLNNPKYACQTWQRYLKYRLNFVYFFLPIAQKWDKNQRINLERANQNRLNFLNNRPIFNLKPLLDSSFYFMISGSTLLSHPLPILGIIRYVKKKERVTVLNRQRTIALTGVVGSIFSDWTWSWTCCVSGAF